MKRSALQRRTPLRAKPKAPAAPRERRLPDVPVVAPKPRAVMAAAANAPRPAPKAVTHRGGDWLAAVRSLPNCVLCGAPGVEAAHRNEGKGGATKAHDCWTAGLCRACHQAIDQGKDMTRDERRAMIDRAIVLTLAELVLAGKVAVTR